LVQAGPDVLLNNPHKMDLSTVGELGVLITGLTQLLKDFYDKPWSSKDPEISTKKRLAFISACAALIGAVGLGYLTGSYLAETLVLGAVFGAAVAGDVGLGLQVAKLALSKKR